MRIRNEAVLRDARLRANCETCGEHAGGRGYGLMEASHLIAKGMGGGRQIDHPLNVVSQCRWCHQRWHDGNLPIVEMLDAISRREGVPAGEIEPRIWAMIRQPKTNEARKPKPKKPRAGPLKAKLAKLKREVERTEKALASL